MSILTDKNPIDEIKEYLNWRYSEVYSTDLFAPVDYDEVTDKIGGVVLSRISADISRRNALSILEWINENIETKQDAPITPEFLEGLGFEENFESEHIKESGVFDDYICITVDTSNRKIKVDMGRGTGRNLPHIRTQSQLVGLIAALFGGGE